MIVPSSSMCYFYRIIFLLLCYISIVFFPHRANAQEKILDRKISAVFYQTPFPKAMSELSQKADFDFAYDATLFPKDKKVTANWKKVPLSDAFDEMIASEEHIQYKSIGTQIIFYQKKAVVLQQKNTLNGIIIDARTGKGIANVAISDEYLGHLSYTDSRGNYKIEIPNPDLLLRLVCYKDGYTSKKLKVRLRSDRKLTIGMHEVVSVEPHPIAVINQDTINQSEEEIVLVPEKVATTDTLQQIDHFKIAPIQRKIANFNKLAPLGEDLINFFINENAKKQAERFSETLKKTTFQIGILPVLNTNFLENSNSVNNVSFNLLAGYSAGLKGFELAGIVNIERYNVSGFQVAGVSNFVNGRSSGFQIAGAFNVSKLEARGVQIAGGINYTSNYFVGAQIAGAVNISNGKLRGLQLAGLTNVARDGGKGWQLAALNNVAANERMEGLQMSVFNNAAYEYDGTQLAVFRNVVKDSLSGLQASVYKNIVKGNGGGGQLSILFNSAQKNYRGFQAAVFSNIVKQELTGTQLGLFNSTKTLRGMQIGFINSASEVEKGVPLGLLSFVEKGYKRLDIGVHEKKFAEMQFKTGLRKFYNILGAGYHYGKNDAWYIGYGFGTAPRLVRNILGLNFDFAGYYVNEYKRSFEDLNWLFRNQTNLTLKLGKRLEVFGGISINAQLSDLKDGEGNSLDSTLPHGKRVFLESINKKGQDWTMWRGWQVGLRIGRIY